MKKQAYETPETTCIECVTKGMIAVSPPYADGGIGYGSGDGGYSGGDGEAEGGSIGWGGSGDSDDEVGAKGTGSWGAWE